MRHGARRKVWTSCEKAEEEEEERWGRTRREVKKEEKDKHLRDER